MGYGVKILVAVKRVIDYRVKVRLKSDQSGVETAQVKMSMNPFDEIALEQAVQLVEQGLATEVVVVSCGTKSVQETLRTGLAMGASRAIWVDTPDTISPAGVAKVLAAVVEKEQPQLVLLGKQAIDNDGNQVGQMLAGYLDWPQATFASKCVFSEDKTQATVTREVDIGLETIKIQLPAVITTDLRLNEPRFISLPNIMKAKSKPIEAVSCADLAVDVAEKVSVVGYAKPPQRQAGRMVADLAEMLDILKQQGCV